MSRRRQCGAYYSRAVFSVTRADTKNLHLIRTILHYHIPHSYAQRKQSQKHFAEKS